MIGAFLALGACGAPPRPPPAPPPAAAAPPPAPPPKPAPPPVPGPLRITFIHGPTAQLFHVVDELSAWHPRSLNPYVAWAATELPLDDAEHALLAAHAKLRRKRRWGAIDQAFDVEAAVDDAAKAAALGKHLTAADAEAERTLLTHFAPRLMPLVEAQASALSSVEEHFKETLPDFAPVATALGRLCEVTEDVPVPIVLAPDPSPTDGGSRFESNVLVVEVTSDDDPLPTLVHELFHALLMRRRSSFAIAATKCDEPIDEETLEEGVAYALAPGLMHAAGTDPLADLVKSVEGNRRAEPQVRDVRLGLALRDDLRAALGGADTLVSFLGRACDAWAQVAKAGKR